MTLQGRTILAIDDSVAILTFLRISLELQGAVFHTAANAAEGIHLCQALRPDLIILDLGLPDRSGLEILPELCRLPSDGLPPVVIVLTVRKEATIRHRALIEGASAYLTKPFLMEELLDAIEEQLRQRAGA